MKKDYREKIIEILDRYNETGEDLETSLLTGSPEFIDAIEANFIAGWISEEAESAWGEDPRYMAIAEEIRELIATNGE